MLQLDARQRAAMHSMIAEDIVAFAGRRDLIGAQELHEICEDLHSMLDTLAENEIDVFFMRMQLNGAYASMA
ncbi:hypothetical protein [Labrys monachus]|jgi:hypothetical protein|uniref:Uncharacterized protein n=1 Tax=Labrys monachus TaxID=217067 RepID=A0ABU0FGY8_9HYPH|nr:hypothetical protein [Labrys monachus]MDQ0393330.1 hypothetical protein [Labrys monachus]